MKKSEKIVMNILDCIMISLSGLFIYFGVSYLKSYYWIKDIGAIIGTLIALAIAIIRNSIYGLIK